jgi:hypothetical protein
MKYPYLLLLTIIMVLISTACGKQIGQLPVDSATPPVLPTFPNCMQAELVSETIPVGTKFQAGVKFDKTWVIRNVSPCYWDSDYSLVYYAGDGMGESTHLLFTANLPQGAIIPPGAEATLTLNLRAPFAAGRQVGYWKLRDSAGILFMPVNVKENAFRVDIEIIGTVYSFVDNLCQATWSLNGQKVDCPAYDDSGTYRLLVNSFPVFEGQNAENEPSIELSPSNDEGSTIIGTFPPLVIQSGDHLHLGTGCVDDTPQCDLNFTVTTKTDSGSTIIGEWREISDGSMQSIDLDLSLLQNQLVQFVFTVRSNGAIQSNRGFWFFPILLPY